MSSACSEPRFLVLVKTASGRQFKLAHVHTCTVLAKTRKRNVNFCKPHIFFFQYKLGVSRVYIPYVCCMCCEFHMYEWFLFFIKIILWSFLFHSELTGVYDIVTTVLTGIFPWYCKRMFHYFIFYFCTFSHCNKKSPFSKVVFESIIGQMVILGIFMHIPGRMHLGNILLQYNTRCHGAW